MMHGFDSRRDNVYCSSIFDIISVSSNNCICMFEWACIFVWMMQFAMHPTQEKRRVNTDPFLHRIYTIGLYMVQIQCKNGSVFTWCFSCANPLN